MGKLDLDKCDGICVIGGDGILQEVVTGLLRREDRERVSQIPIGFIPVVGTASTYATNLHTDPSQSLQSRVGRAALAMVEQTTRKVDAMEITNNEGQVVYAMSSFGYGFMGVAAEEAGDAAYLKDHRYWYVAAPPIALSAPPQRMMPNIGRGAVPPFVKWNRVLPPSSSSVGARWCKGAGTIANVTLLTTHTTKGTAHAKQCCYEGGLSPRPAPSALEMVQRKVRRGVCASRGAAAAD